MEPTTSETTFDCTMPANGKHLLIAGLSAHGKTLAALETAADFTRRHGHVALKSYDHGFDVLTRRLKHHLPDGCENGRLFQFFRGMPPLEYVRIWSKDTPVLVVIDHVTGMVIEGVSEYPSMLLRLQALEQRYSMPNVRLLVTCATNREGRGIGKLTPLAMPKGWEMRIVQREWARPFYDKLIKR